MIKGELPPEGETQPTSARRIPRQMSLDPLSKSIVEQLQYDGRKPAADIADELGVTEGAVARAIEELASSHVIRILGVSSGARLGFTHQAMLGLHVEAGAASGVAESVALLPEVVYLLETTGYYDVLAEVFTTSDEHLEKTVARLAELPHVTGVRPYPYVGVRKQTYSWAVR